MRTLSPWFLCSCLASVFSWIKRIIFGRQKKEKLDLPVTSRPRPEGQESHEDEGELQNWDSWGDDDGLTSIKIDQSEPEEPDFFADMTPTFKKAALIRKKPNRSHDSHAYSSSSTSSRLTMGVDDTSALSNELGTWNDESGTWEEEALDVDLDEAAESVIKEKREAERKRRAAEQQRKKAEKEAQRAIKKDNKLAVKVS